VEVEERRRPERVKRLPREVRERQILDAAVQVFSRHGYHSASMDEVSDVAGVSKPMIYAYLGSKEDLFGQCIRREATRLLEAVTLGIRMERAVPRSARSFVALGSGYSLAVYGLHAFILAVIWSACGGAFLRMGALPGIPVLVATVGLLSIAAAAAIAWIDKRGLLLGIESSIGRAVAPRLLPAPARSR